MKEDIDQFAMEFADYMENERWEYDHREQKTHTMREHLKYFKAKYYPIEKGDYLGECNRTACQNTDANYYNYSTKKFYCAGCARLINQYNRADAMRMYGHDLCVPYGQPTSEI